jgi:replicative DNA helicase
MNNKIPPHNIEIEESILSSCLLMPTKYVELIETISPDDFYKTIHQKIFKSIQSLYKSEQPIDLISVRNENQDISHTVLAEISDAPAAMNSEYSKDILIGNAKLRKLIELGNALMKRGFNGKSDDVTRHVDYAQREALKIGEGMGKKAFRHISGIMEDTIDRCETISKSGGLTGVPSGFKDLDALMCGFQPGDLIIMAGRPSVGKTALATQCIANASKADYRSAFFSLEMPDWQVGNRFLSNKSQTDSLKFRSGKFNSEDWVRLHEAAGEIYKWKLFVDDSSNLHYQDIVQRGRTIKRQEGSDIFWIDYLSFLQGDKDGGKVGEIESITRTLKALAKELSIPIVLVCQLNRKCEERPNKRPILSDLRDSGAIEQDSDVVLFLYRHSRYVKRYNEDGMETAEYQKCKNIAEINIAKQRNGPTETIGLFWNESTTTFGDLMRTP